MPEEAPVTRATLAKKDLTSFKGLDGAVGDAMYEFASGQPGAVAPGDAPSGAPGCTYVDVGTGEGPGEGVSEGVGTVGAAYTDGLDGWA